MKPIWPGDDLVKGIGGGGDARIKRKGNPVSIKKDTIIELDGRAARTTNTYGNAGRLPRSIDIILVGCGGNGSYVVPQMMRFLKTLMERVNRPTTAGHARTDANLKFEITLIDGDLIEQKNLVRQNFIAPDVGKNKAIVLAQRYGKAFGLEVGAIDKYLDEEMAGNLIWCGNSRSQIILGCVDNNATRKVLHELIVEKPKGEYVNLNHLFWIDVANETFDGQLSIGYRSQHFGYKADRSAYGAKKNVHTNEFWDELEAMISEMHKGLPVINRGLHFPMPCITEIFPEMLTGKKDFDPNDPSCAEAAEQVQQAMVTNIMSSTLMFSAFCQCVAMLIDPGDENAVAGFTERRPRSHMIHFGHGGRFAVTSNTSRSLREVFVHSNGEKAE
ncbi:MAG: ThiF family adenylyltransferase, partial [Anaerolineales bacterium]|nr:ThiF family adenylyltransferase [Anaerolineales bacterium]